MNTLDRFTTEPPMTLPLADLELSKAAKRKGFNVPTFDRFIKEKPDTLDDYNKHFTVANKDLIMRPTLELLKMWLIEKMNLHVYVFVEIQGWDYGVADADGTGRILISEDGNPDYPTALRKGLMAALTNELYHTFIEEAPEGVFSRYYRVEEYTKEQAEESLKAKYPNAVHQYVGEKQLHSVKVDSDE